METLKHYIRITLLAILLTGMVSCNNDNGAEDLFSETATERLNEREQEVMDALLASEQGWKVMYFTDNEEFGGFTLLMKFREDGTVDMTSDIDEDTEVITSRFDIKLGNTVKLTFSTRNHIHKLADSYFPQALRGSGYKGSGEFLYYGKEGDDRLSFKSVRDRETEQVIFEKATAEDWAGTIAANHEVREHIEGRPSDPVYRGIVLTKDGEETLYPFSYDVLRRYVNISGTTSDGKIENKSFGVSFAPGKMLAFPALELEGYSFSEFVWDDTGKKFISRSSSNASIEITFLERPIHINDDYKSIGTTVYSLAFAPGERYDQVLNTPNFRELYTRVNHDIKEFNQGIELQDIVLRFNRPVDEPEQSNVLDFYFTIGETRYYARYTVGFTEENKKLKFTYLGEVGGNAQNLRVYFLPLIEFFVNEEGFYVNNEGRFWSQYTNPGYTLTSAEDATFRVHCASNYYRNN